MSEQLVEHLSAFEEIISKYDGFVVDEATRIRKDLNVASVEALQEQIQALAEEKRLLNIGIIGRVKAGKSSLLNALFFEGEDILPKAATPMTASLTVITHGEEFSATVEYFTLQDIAQIETEYRNFLGHHEKIFKQKLKEITDKNKDLLSKGKALVSKRLAKGKDSPTTKTGVKPEETPEVKAKRQTERELKDHAWAASFQQYERMKKSGKLTEMRNLSRSEEHISVDNLETLKGRLGDYVGSEGPLMPFTKSVSITLPLDSLRNIQVVDTPGINDPVRSREARTEDYLKKCDVVFIVSPAGQFLSREDTNLMDRLATREGVRELYLVASQSDSQLHGDIREKSGRDLHKALDIIRYELGRQAVDTLKAIKHTNSEVGDSFDQLITGESERVMVTSAICHAMRLRFEHKEGWDDGMRTAWTNLARNYPDFFCSASSSESSRIGLKTLANIGAMQDGMNAARQAKDSIMERKRADYLTGQMKTALDFRNELIKSIETQIELVRNTDITQVVAQKTRVEMLYEIGSAAVDDAFEDSLDNFRWELREMIYSKAKKLFADACNETEGKVEAVRKTGQREKSGLGNLLARKLWGGGNESYTYEVTTVRTSAVKSIINNVVYELQSELDSAVDKAKQEWKKTVQRKVTSELIESIDGAGDIYHMLTKALLHCIGNMELPDMEIGFPFSTNFSGVLEGSDAESFMDEIRDYISNLRPHYGKRTDIFIKNIVESAKREKISELIFKDIRVQIETLEKSINNKQFTLDRLNRCLSELKSLE